MKIFLPSADDRGFTLLELVLVIVVLGIISAIALPRFFNPGDFQERSYFDQVASAYRYAQKYAMATGCDVQVQIAADSSFGLNQGSGGCHAGPYNLPVPHPTQGGAFTGSPPGVATISPAPSTLTFYAQGNASANLTVNVGGHSFNVVAATGFVDTQ